MKTVLVGALVLSIAANVWLVSRSAREEVVTVRTTTVVTLPATAGGATRAPRAGRAEAESPAGPKPDLAALQAELAALREKAAALDTLEPIALVLYSNAPLRDRVRRVRAIEPEKERMMAAWKLGQLLAEKDGAAADVLAALRGETDAESIRILGELLRAGASSKATEADRRGFVELLRTSPSAEVRAACVRGVWISGARTSAEAEKLAAIQKEMNAALVDAIRADTSPEVVGAIARAMADWSPPPEALDALRDAANRLPASPGRRAVWEAVARGTFMGDAGASLVGSFEGATAQDLKDDIAAGLARAGNSVSGRMGGTPEDAQKRIEDARRRLLAVYGGTSDATIRKSLVRGTMYGLGCVGFAEIRSDDGRASAVRFYRDLASLERDADLRSRLEQLAAAVEAKGVAGLGEMDRIVFGRE